MLVVQLDRPEEAEAGEQFVDGGLVHVIEGAVQGKGKEGAQLIEAHAVEKVGGIKLESGPLFDREVRQGEGELLVDERKGGKDEVLRVAEAARRWKTSDKAAFEGSFCGSGKTEGEGVPEAKEVGAGQGEVMDLPVSQSKVPEGIKDRAGGKKSIEGSVRPIQGCGKGPRVETQEAEATDRVDSRPDGVEHDAAHRDILPLEVEDHLLREDARWCSGSKGEVPPQRHVEAPRSLSEAGEGRRRDVGKATKKAAERRGGSKRAVERIRPCEEGKAPHTVRGKKRKKRFKKREPGAALSKHPTDRPLGVSGMHVLAEGEHSNAPPRGRTQSGLVSIRREDFGVRGGSRGEVAGNETVDSLLRRHEEGRAGVLLGKFEVVEELGEAVGRSSECAPEGGKVETMDGSQLAFEGGVPLRPQRSGVHGGVDSKEDSERFGRTDDGDALNLLGQDARAPEGGSPDGDQLGFGGVEALSSGVGDGLERGEEVRDLGKRREKRDQVISIMSSKETQGSWS